MNARSTTLGSWKFSSRTSTSATSTPSERSAFEIPRPVASETSRSLPGPPIRTAILFGSVFMSSWFSHDLDLGFQFNPALCPRSRLDQFDLFEHFRLCRSAIVDNQFAVHLRHPCFP